MSYNTQNYKEQGGEIWHVHGKIIIEADGELKLEEGATMTGGVAADTATATQAGAVELATSAEAITGTDTERAVTPKALADAVPSHVPAASATASGKVELATDAETIAITDAARAVTPHSLGAALSKLFAISFAGHNGAGACTATGVAVGDVILSVTGLTDVGQVDASFEATVTVADQIQQSSETDLSSKNFLALIYRPA